jgi:hypothetical protein
LAVVKEKEEREYESSQMKRRERVLQEEGKE